MTIRFLLVFFFFIILSKSTVKACSGTGEIALCNIIHQPSFLANGLVWIGEPTNTCEQYFSYSGAYTACQFKVIEVLSGSINTSDTLFTNTDSLVWLIGGPSNLCYENANYTSGTHLFASRFQNHYATEGSFGGYSTYAFNADHFELKDTMIGNFINDINYFDPLTNLGPDTILLSQLPNVVDNCITEIGLNDRVIDIYSQTNQQIFTISGDLTDYRVEVVDIHGVVVEDYSETPQTTSTSIHIDTTLLPAGLYFVKVQHKQWPDVYVERVLKE